MRIRSILPGIALLGALGFSLTFVLGDMGLVRLLHLRQDMSELQRQHQRLQYDISLLASQIERYRNDRDYIESRARDVLGMHFPGERVIRIHIPKENRP